MLREKNGYTTGLVIIMAMLMLGMLTGGSFFGYHVYRKHTMVLEMARDSQMEARIAEDQMQSSAVREAELAAHTEELRERISRLEEENAELRDRLGAHETK